MEKVNPKSLEYSQHQVTKCTFTETYTIQDKDLNNQSVIAWSGQQLGKDIAAPYFLKKGDTIMPNKWFRHKDSMTVVVINHKEINHELTIKVTDCHFFNGSDDKLPYEVKNVTVSFKYWIMRKETDVSSIYKSLVESATVNNPLFGDFLKVGFPIGEDSIEKRLEKVIREETKNAVKQQQPVEKSTLETAIEKAIDAKRNDLFQKYGLNYKDISAHQESTLETAIEKAIDANRNVLFQKYGLNYKDISVKLENSITPIGEAIKKQIIDETETISALQHEGNNHKLELKRTDNEEEIKTKMAEKEQEREALKPDYQRVAETFEKNPHGGEILVKVMNQGPNLNGCNPPMVGLLKPAQQIETANQKGQPAALLS